MGENITGWETTRAKTPIEYNAEIVIRPFRAARLSQMMALGLLATIPMQAQNPGYGVGPVDRGLVIGAAVGIGAVLGLGITYLVLHNKGVVTGCISELSGKKILVGDDKKTWTFSDGGGSLAVGDRVKLKGQKADTDSGASFRVDKMVRDYGKCPA